MLQIIGTPIVCELHRCFIAVAGTVVIIMTAQVASLQTLLFGLVELCVKELGLTHLSGSWPGFLALLHEDGEAGLALSSPLMMLQDGLALLVCL